MIEATFSFHVPDEAALVQLERLFLKNGLDYKRLEEPMPLQAACAALGGILPYTTLFDAVTRYKTVPGVRVGRQWHVKLSDVKQAIEDGRLSPGKFGRKQAMNQADKLTSYGRNEP